MVETERTENTGFGNRFGMETENTGKPKNLENRLRHRTEPDTTEDTGLLRVLNPKKPTEPVQGTEKKGYGN